MDFKWNNVKPTCCAKWLVLPTVYSDALSYGELLDKFCYQLNQLIDNNNILPDFIAEMIKEYINSGAIGEVVRDILADYILNVKYPPKGITPAVGDGSADDTEALQGCIDYASENGGVVYFPYGSYLTQPLTMKSGVSLFGFDRYSTKVVLKGGATKDLLNGNASNLSVCGITLNGNSGNQVNDVNVIGMSGSDLMFNMLIIKDGYKLFNFVGGGHLQLDDIVFGSAVENCVSIDGNVIVQAKNLLFTGLSKVSGVSVIDIKANDGNYDFNSVAKCDTCMLISGNNNNVTAVIGGANEDYVDTGNHNNIDIVGHSIKKYYSGNIKKDANNEEITLQGTRSIHVVGENTIAIDSNSTESVEGTRSIHVVGENTIAIDSNSTESVKGTRSIHVVGENTIAIDSNSAESVDGNKSLIVIGTTNETYTGTKTTNSNEKIENFKKMTLKGTGIDINTDNAIKYRTPTNKDYYGNVDMMGRDNVNYHILTENENTKYLQNIFKSIEEFGAIGDGLTDDTIAIKNALAYAVSNNTNIVTRGKKYKITEDLTINGFVFDLNTGEIIGNNTIIITNGGRLTNGVITNGNVVLREGKNNVDYITIKEWDGKAIELSTGCFECFVHHIRLENNKKTNTEGIVFNASDCTVDYIYGYGAKTGIVNNGADNYVENAHLWLNANNDFSGSVFLKQSSTLLTLSNCCCDSYETFLYQTANHLAANLTNCYFINNNTLFKNKALKIVDGGTSELLNGDIMIRMTAFNKYGNTVTLGNVGNMTITPIDGEFADKHTFYSGYIVNLVTPTATTNSDVYAESNSGIFKAYIPLWFANGTSTIRIDLSGLINMENKKSYGVLVGTTTDNLTTECTYSLSDGILTINTIDSSKLLRNIKIGIVA